MNNNIPVIFTILTLTSGAFAQSADKSIAPLQTYILTVDGVPHELISDRDTELQISDKKYHVVLKKNQTRRFNYAGVSFEFDTSLHFSYEALAPAVDHWSLDGNNSVIMVQKYSSKVEYSEIVESFLTQYRQMKAGTELSEATLAIGGEIKTGKRLNVSFAKIKLEQQIFYFNNNNSAVVIILQDTLTDSGAHTAEFVNLRNLVEKTLSVDL